jgi:hypothetical protein
MADLSTGVPERVWRRAVSRGLHGSCILTGQACSACEATILAAFEDVYGAAENMDEVLGMIAYDLALEKAQELAS